LDWLDLVEADELRRFGLGGNPHALLVEFPYHGWPLSLEWRVRELAGRGITAVLAHPERNADVQADPARLRPILAAGSLVQVTAAAVDGRAGLASDAHTSDVRGIGMSEAARAVGDEALARWLTHDVPAAVLAGAPVPPRP
jgi:protein-tyrosine phosphatase